MFGKTRTGIALPPVCDYEGSLIARISGGRLADAALNGRLFSVSNAAAVATTTTLNTTWTGLGIANPLGSGKNLIIHKFSWALSVVGSAAGALCLAETVHDSGFVAALTIRCCKWGGGTSVAYADDGATVVAPIILMPIATYGTGAITTWQGATNQVADIDGAIVVPQGRTLLTDTTTVLTTGPLFGFVWEEVPV
jgi:hypothetical protein